MLDTLLSYSLDDLLLFSPEVYWQLLGDFIQARKTTLPWLIVIAIPALAALCRPRLHGLGSALLALLWASCGWQFYDQYYANINPFLAPLLAWVCYAQALLALLWAGWWHCRPVHLTVPAQRWVLTAFVLCLLPMLLLSGLMQMWWAQLLPGLMPIPTTLFSLLLVSGFAGRARLALLPLALVVLAIECTTQCLLQAPLGWLNAALGLALLLWALARPAH